MKNLLTIMILYLLLTLSQAWSLPTCPGSPQTEESGNIFWDNCIGTYIIPNVGKYIGGYKNDKMHGQGTLTFADGEKYVGGFKDGKKHGQGTLTLATGEKYVGELKNEKRNGQGINTWANGDKYIGEWKDDNRHGQGTFTSEDGKYVGDWKDDNRHGQGTMTLPEGDKYVGKWKDSVMHGQGTITFVDGRVLQGEFKDNEWVKGKEYAAGEYNSSSQVSSLPTCPGSPQTEGSGNILWDNCIGTYNWTKGDNKGLKYVGEWKDDKKHGQGTITSPKGDKYVGDFKDDNRHGQGTYTFANGNKYVGEWKDSNRHGQGTYFWADGEVWQGEFKDDEWVNGKKYAAGKYNPSSQVSSLPTCLGSPQTEGSGNIFWDNCIGTYTWTKGDNKGLKYVGEWKDDKKNGQGTFTSPEGDKYVGEFKDDNRHGQGTYTFANGNKYVGEYKDDKIHGQGTTTFATGEKYVGEWKDAKRNGHGINIWVNGEKYVGEWKDSNRHGQGTYSFTDGRVWQGQWRNDEWVNGRKYAAGEYNPSSQVSRLPTCPGSPQTEESGNIFWDNCIGTYNWTKGEKYVGGYKNDKKHGQGTMISPEGDKYVGEWKEDKMHGQGTITFVDGTKYVGSFKDDELDQGTITSVDGSVMQGQWRNGEWVTEKEYAAGEYNPSEKENDNKQYIDPNKIINAASGSGFIVSSLGHVLTNNHVIEGCNEVKIHYNGEKYKASIIAKDDYNDIALLKANFTPSIIFSIKNGNAELMEDIYVAGYPFGDFFNSSVKITKGIVSSLSGFKNNFSNMQIDAALQPGNSGGPVIDYKGNVVGVAVAKLDLSTMIEIFDSVPENTNFAIKSSVLLNFLNANGIQTKKASEKIMARSELSETITKGTLYLSCWMTQARIEKMKTQKVLFNNIIE